MEEIKKIIKLLDYWIKDNAESSLTGWNIIKDSFDLKVDEYREIIYNSKDWLSKYQSELIEETKINSLKIKYTNASWYFIEIPKSQINNINDNFILKQTLVNSSRYITLELKEFEQKFLNAEWLLFEREYELFLEIRLKILKSFNKIKKISDDIAFIDFQFWLSKIAYLNNYNKPKITKNYDLKILWWRHPVIENIEKDFISNNLKLTKSNFVHIITWPNMWWKSTFLRQNALIILMSHIWSYVPVVEAEIPLIDKIFSRVWASDNLFLWQSTFMVEMQEVANIINNSTKNSFVIIDEVWRWTSTYDWISLAWWILKENHDKIKAKTLFATHYHELIDQSKNLKWVKNFSVAVWENSENLVFLRKIIPWGIKKSYWIEVARLAWINDSILKQANIMLKSLELTWSKLNWFQLSIDNNILKENNNENEFNKELKNNIISNKLVEKIKKININELTPIEWLNILYEFKKILKNNEK